ncbi:CLUMA_CG008902, isoform A [Clunio marinus]|uniref:CLUMA_CG008902, isoform A n=1 Tax=Clunio marinus TaxID=568069 RepID=A0A1J1I5C9_9DIPT|nr:CLUMA_CG008902, isoform A [Clunio marinus]
MHLYRIVHNIRSATRLKKKNVPNWEEICGDLHAVRIIGQTGGFPKSSKESLKRSLQCVLQKSKEFAVEEESPPKKRKIDGAPCSKNVDKSISTSTDEKNEQVTNASNDNMKIEESSNECEKGTKENENSATTSLAQTKAQTTNDIESHIEIIYECLDELNEASVNTTGSNSTSSNKTITNDTILISSETSSQENIETANESAEIGDVKSNDPTAAQNESKNE